MVRYKKYLMSLIRSVMLIEKKGRSNMIIIFLFWFEEDLISLYNEYKLEAKSVYDKKDKSKVVRKTFST